MTKDNIIETHELTRIYGDGAQVRALDGVSVRVTRGEFLTVMGPSGSGKSTLLNLLGALDRPTSGEVYINGQNLARVKNLDTFRAQTVGFVFQMHNLIPTLNARENVETPMMGQVIGAGKRRKRAEDCSRESVWRNAQRICPTRCPAATPASPSPGALAKRTRTRPRRRTHRQPRLEKSGADVIAPLRQLNHELGTTIIIVTHDPAVARQTDRVLVMRDGAIADDHRVGHPFEEDLKEFRSSGLGKALLDGDPGALAWLASSGLGALQHLLNR